MLKNGNNVKVKKTLVNILFFLNVLAVIALIISYTSIYIPPDQIWIPSLFGLAYPFILALNILFIVFWLLFKPRLIFLSLLIILLGWGFLTKYIQLRGKTLDRGDIKILSYNVKHFDGNGKSNQKENADKIKDFLLKQDADIICLQEVRLRRNSIFNLPETVHEFQNIHHYQYARSSTTFGSVTLTRYPVVFMGEIRFENSRNITIYTDVLIGKDTVRIFNVHLQSYQIDPKNYSIIESPGLKEEKDLEEVREMGLKFKKAFRLRAEQVREIRKYIEESPYHVLVCGDFNDTPASYSYRQLRKGLEDAFVSSGQGIGRTYIGSLPSFRIDNIFHSQGFESYNFKTYDFNLSDHLPISCELIKK